MIRVIRLNYSIEEKPKKIVNQITDHQKLKKKQIAIKRMRNKSDIKFK